MTRSEEHLNAMLRHLGAAYYDATQGRASRSDVNRALDTVAEIMHTHHIRQLPVVDGPGHSGRMRCYSRTLP